MLKIGSIFILGLSFTASLLNSDSLNDGVYNDQYLYSDTFKGDKEFKHGQYVYVTLKDGSQTVGKIVGKKTSKKYYVNQLDGGHHGSVHVKYIRKMTKEEIASYVASKKQ